MTQSWLRYLCHDSLMFALDNTSAYGFLRSVTGSEVYPISSSENFTRPSAKRWKGYMGWRRTPKSLHIPQKFLALQQILTPNEYCWIVNDDLRFHNTFFGINWKIAGMIDLDAVRAFRQFNLECPRWRAGEGMELGRCFYVNFFWCPR